MSHKNGGLQRAGLALIFVACAHCFPDVEGSSTSCEHSRNFASIAYQAGTDKVRVHNYAPLYERFLGPLRCTSFNFLEWGFASGASAVAWREYLPLAKISEIEIGCFPHSHFYKPSIAHKPRHKEWISGNVSNAQLYCGNAVNFTWVDSSALMQHVGPLRVVIDDGGHSSKEMALSFFFYFVRIVPGGLFFMEDIGTAYDRSRRKYGFVEGILKPLLDDLNRDIGTNDTLAQPPAFPELLGMVKSVSCEQQICVIERSSLPSFDILGSTALAMWRRVQKQLPAEFTAEDADSERRRQTQSNVARVRHLRGKTGAHRRFATVNG